MLSLEHVTVAYRDRLAIHDIDLTIEAGERVALIGPNGAGKSTLLSVSTGAIEPASGAVQPMIPPCARIISMAACLNSGK